MITPNVKLISISEKPEQLIEYAARVCYNSQDKMGKSKSLIPALIRKGHESPLEHACATFEIKNISRACSHQLVRHRLMSVSQKSQRYVSEENFKYIIPKSFIPDSKDIEEYKMAMEYIKQAYCKWKNNGISKEDARYLLPNACTTDIIITANFREFRHIFKIRCSPQAQWEIRDICYNMLNILNKHAPNVFNDLV
jgi:thymidylate synthase (FAD)